LVNSLPLSAGRLKDTATVYLFSKLTAVVVDVEMLMRALVGPPTSTVTWIIVN
jgi:hypothetical protein